MSKKQLNPFAVVMTAVLTWMAAVPAQAGIADLAALLKSPVGRFLMLETEEGLSLSLRLLGSGEVLRPDPDLLIARLGRREMSKTASELEIRLRRAYNRFQFRASLGEDARELLQVLARAELASSLGEGGVIEFVPEEASVKSFAAERETFLKAKNPRAMAGTDLSGRRMSPDSNVSGADLRFANLVKLQAKNLVAEDAQLIGATLEEAELTDTVFKGADLTAASLRSARLRNADLRSATLYGADLRGAHLNGADLRGADLRGADLSTAHVEARLLRSGVDVKFEGALYDAQTKLPFSHEEAIRLGMIFIGD